MNQMIKTRLKQIKNGEVPDGYKKTDVGIVPFDWSRYLLSDLFDFKNGLNKEKEAFGNGTPIINYTDVWGRRGLCRKDIKGRVSLSRKEIALYKVEEGDVFFTRTSETINEIGLSSVLLEPIDDCVFSGFVLRARPKNNVIVKEYNQYCYSTAIMRHEIIRKSSMTTRALTNGVLLGEINICLPGRAEQEIAEILMTQDRLIRLKEELIEEKKKQKKYLMDVLLTGKIRLPGFSGEWEVKKLREICLIERGTPIDKTHIQSGEIPVIAGGQEPAYYHNKANRQGNVITISGSGASAGYVAFHNYPIFASDCSTITEAEGFNILFTFYYLSFYQDKLYDMQIGCAQPHVYPKTIGCFLINLPSMQEQKAIAEVLSKADDEIELLQKELEEQKRKKQALMQLLLTGIVRVKV